MRETILQTQYSTGEGVAVWQRAAAGAALVMAATGLMATGAETASASESQGLIIGATEIVAETVPPTVLSPEAMAVDRVVPREYAPQYAASTEVLRVKPDEVDAIIGAIDHLSLLPVGGVDVEVTGRASAENDFAKPFAGMAEQGVPGNPNVELATQRGQHVGDAITQRYEAQNGTAHGIPVQVRVLPGVARPLSPTDLGSLSTLAETQGYGASDPDGRNVATMVASYNHGKADKATSEELDTLLDGARKVEVRIRPRVLVGSLPMVERPVAKTASPETEIDENSQQTTISESQLVGEFPSLPTGIGALAFLALGAAKRRKDDEPRPVLPEKPVQPEKEPLSV